MATFLKQSTAIDVSLGPFVDDADGVTAMTGLTITQPDIRLKKNGGAWAQKNAAQTLSHEEAGWYEVALDTTDTNTLGNLLISIAESGALPVWREFQVVTANVWDSLFGADLLQVDTREVTGTAQTAGDLKASLNTIDDFIDTEVAAIITTLGTPAGASVSADVAAVKVDTAAILVDTGTTLDARIPAALVGGRMDANVGAISSDATAADNAEAFFDGTGYAGTNNVIPTVTTVTTVSGLAANSITAAALAADAGAEIADAVWDEALAGHAGAGSTGEQLSAAGAAGDPWATTVPGAYGAGTAGQILGDNLNATVSSRATPAQVATELGTYDAPTHAELVSEINAVQADIAGLSIPTVGAIADGVWDEALAGHAGAGSTGEQLSAAGAAGDPWSTAVPGAYGAGTAGQILGDNLNATVSSRASQASLDTVDDFLDTEVAAIKLKTDLIPADPAETSDIPSAGTIATAVLNAAAAAPIASDLKKINNTTVNGDGSGTPWGP